MTGHNAGQNYWPIIDFSFLYRCYLIVILSDRSSHERAIRYINGKDLELLQKSALL